MKYVLTILVLIMFSGCAKSDLTQLDLDANRDMAKATAECHKARQIDLTGIPAEAIGYVVMSKQFGDALLAVTGNDPCNSTNVFDVQIAEVKAKNEALSKTTGNILNLGKWIVGGVVATSAFEAMGNTYSATDSASMSTSVDSGNTANADSYNTATSTDESYNTAAGTSMDTVTP